MGENRKEENRRVGEEGFEDPLVPAGNQANEEAWQEEGGDGNGSSCCRIWAIEFVSNCIGKGNPLADKCEATGKEEEDESWREKSSQVFLLLRKDPAWSHLQVLGDAQRGGDD